MLCKYQVFAVDFSTLKPKKTYGVPITLTSLTVALPCLGREQLVQAMQASPEKRTYSQWFSRTWSPLKHLVPKEHSSGEQLHQPSNKWCLGGKKARVAFHCNHHWGRCSFMELSIAVSRKLQASCFVSFVRLLWGSYCLSIFIFCPSPFGKRSPFHT